MKKQKDEIPQNVVAIVLKRTPIIIKCLKINQKTRIADIVQAAYLQGLTDMGLAVAKYPPANTTPRDDNWQLP